ncbi:hypothetical protein XENOCAPTIV_006863 [Xenoophorus captivus]|uniref:Uncharacterized protein n=1 Tax=Xenoophorus captivus TaxID=1517983 RepID=A0ABV0Q9C0_9TELE
MFTMLLSASDSADQFIIPIRQTLEINLLLNSWRVVLMQMCVCFVLLHTFCNLYSLVNMVFFLTVARGGSGVYYSWVEVSCPFCVMAFQLIARCTQLHITERKDDLKGAGVCINKACKKSTKICHKPSHTHDCTTVAKHFPFP